MLSNITTGNAKTDGNEFRFWFVGQVGRWCRENNVPYDEKKYGLRNTDDIEIKWGRYKKGEVKKIWAPCSDKIAMSILIRGDFIFYFRDAQEHDKCKEVRLKEEGDYAIWREDVEHAWKMFEDSEIITLRWKGEYNSQLY